MAKNLRKGSKVSFILDKRSGTLVKGVVTKKFTARKGELDVPDNRRTLVSVKALGGQQFSKIPSQLKRRKK